MTDNSTYEQRIANPKYETASEWQACLQENAGVPKQFGHVFLKQARAKNGWKPIGAYFGNVDWIEKKTHDNTYSRRLENGDVTMPGTLIESIHHWFREVPLTYQVFQYSPESVDVVVKIAADVLRAAEIDETRCMQGEQYASVEAYVEEEHIDRHEKDLLTSGLL